MTATGFRRHPELPFLECRYAKDSTACYEPHAHPTVSIGIVESGCSTVTCGDLRFQAQPGMVLVFDAGQVHACNPDPGEAWSYHMLYIQRTWWRDIAAELTGEASPLPTSCNPVKDVSLATELGRINHKIMAAGANDASQLELQLVSAINKLLSHPMKDTGLSQTALSEPSWIADMRRYIEENYTKTITIDDLCRRANRSKGPLIRRFRQQTGLTPYAYLQNHRINEARARLADGRQIADVAMELGFADQSHLNRLFKRLVASTPGIYRKDLAS